MRKLSLLLAFPVLFMFICAGDLSQWIGKSENQITSIQSRVTKLDSSFFDGKLAAPIRALVQRTNMYRHSSDYSNLQTAVDSGYTVTIDPNDTVSVTSALNLVGTLSIQGAGNSSRIEATGCVLAELDSTEDNVLIDGVYFKGDNLYRGFVLDDADNVIFSNCTFEDFTTAIKMVGTSTNVNVINCNFIDCDTAVAGVNEYNVINSNGAVNIQYNKREISIMDFGASTVDSFDNETAIEAAITWAKANDVSTIFFPKGEYYCTQIMVTAKDSLTFLGQAGTVLKGLRDFPSDYATTAYVYGMFYLYECEHITIDNITFDLNASKWYRLSHYSPVYCYARSGTGYHNKYITIRNCTFYDCSAIKFYAASSDTSVWGAHIINNDFFPQDTLTGIDFDTKGYNVTVTGNQYYGNNVGRQFIVGTVSKAVISNNNVYRCGDSGIYFNSSDLIISSNYLEGCGKDGIKVIQSTGKSIVVSNNLVKGVGREDRGSNVGYNFEASHVILNGNMFITDTTGGGWYWSVQHAVKFGANSDSSIISNNQLYGMGFMGGTSNGYGLLLSTGAAHLQVNGNTFHGFEHGIISAGNNNKNIFIDGNYFHDNRSTDIRFADSYTGKSCIVAQNNIFRDSNYPFIVKTIDTLIVMNNTFLGSLDHNIVTNQGSVTSYYNHNNLRPGTVPSFTSFQIPAGDSIRVGAGTYIWEMEKVSAVDSFDIITATDTLRIGVKRYPK